MKSPLLLVVIAILTSVSIASATPVGIYQQGTVIRIHMADCLVAHDGFLTVFGPPQSQVPEGSCPECTLLTDKVVFVIVCKSSNQLVPLAEVIDFRFQKRELAVRVDDARHESNFVIKEMTVRSNGNSCKDTSKTNSTSLRATVWTPPSPSPLVNGAA
jgi:hypothetical protein